MSIELYLAVNLLADTVLLVAVSHALGVFDPGRVALCGAVCAAYAALAASRPFPWAAPFIQIALLAAVSMLLCRDASPGIWLPVAAALVALALLCGGVARVASLTGLSALPTCLIVGTLLASLAIWTPKAHGGWRVCICLRYRGSTVRFPALIDTGNRLREPISGLPVVIAEASLLKGVMPVEGCRTLRFDALGGAGSMACFRPTELWIEVGRRRRRAPLAWVAVSEAPLPGAFRALAPPEFASVSR